MVPRNRHIREDWEPSLSEGEPEAITQSMVRVWKAHEATENLAFHRQELLPGPGSPMDALRGVVDIKKMVPSGWSVLMAFHPENNHGSPQSIRDHAGHQEACRGASRACSPELLTVCSLAREARP